MHKDTDKPFGGLCYCRQSRVQKLVSPNNRRSLLAQHFSGALKHAVLACGRLQPEAAPCRQATPLHQDRSSVRGSDKADIQTLPDHKRELVQNHKKERLESLHKQYAKLLARDRDTGQELHKTQS